MMKNLLREMPPEARACTHCANRLPAEPIRLLEQAAAALTKNGRYVAADEHLVLVGAIRAYLASGVPGSGHG